MQVRELSNEQRRQLVDVEQTYASWRETHRVFLHSYGGPYQGSMRWVKVKGKDYLYRKIGDVQKSLGPRSAETERIKDDYMQGRARLRERRGRLRDRLKAMAPVNRALRLNRVPDPLCRILRLLDDYRLLGEHLTVVGTNALFAYEIAAGVQFGAGLLATGDIDFLTDARRKASFAASRDKAEGVLGLLRRVDRSFERQARSYVAANADGYMVDLICPEQGPRRSARALGTDETDLTPVEIIGLDWLLNAPKFERMAIGQDGLPTPIVCLDPQVFALHKLWLSRRGDREPAKKRRDADQACAVAAVAQTYFGKDFKGKELSALPSELYALRGELMDAARSYLAERGGDTDRTAW